MFPAFVHDGNLHYPLIFYWNSPPGRASGVETELVEFQLLVAFPFFPFEDNWFMWLVWQKCVPWRLDTDRCQIFVSFTRVVDYASKSESEIWLRSTKQNASYWISVELWNSVATLLHKNFSEKLLDAWYARCRRLLDPSWMFWEDLFFIKHTCIPS